MRLNTAVLIPWFDDPNFKSNASNQSWDENADQIPDTFFQVTNPALLESALDEILSNVSSKSASSASAAGKFDTIGYHGGAISGKI